MSSLVIADPGTRLSAPFVTITTRATVVAMLLSLLVALAIGIIGFGLTAWMSDRLRFEERIAIGVVVGVLATSVTTFLAFELVGMGWSSLLVGLVLPGGAATIGIHRQRAALRADAASAWRRLGLPTARAASLRPLLLLSVASLSVSTRVFSLSYQTTPNGVSAGSLAIWGDWSAHLAYAGSFAYGDNRGLDLPTATGTGFRYHFLVDFFGSLFTVSGVTLQQSMVISAWMLAAAFTPLLWCMVIRLTRSRLTAALTLVLFALSGGVGLWYFGRDVTNQGWGIVTSLPQTYARMPDLHLWVDNTISASLYAQRSTLLGLCAGFAAAIVILASRPSWSRRGFASAGVMIALLGIGHAHTMLTALVFAIMALIADRRRTWLWFIIPIAVIGLPLAWTIRPETNSVRWLLGWMAPQSDQPWPLFWLRNVGLLLPLFAGLSLFGGVSHRLRRLAAPLWLWFIAPNLIAFHPSEWNNTKYFLYWQFAGCLLIAAWFSRAFSSRVSRRPALSRFALQSAVLICVLLMISAGGLDTFRVMQRSTAIPWVEHDDIAAARWLRAHSAPDDVLVYGTNNTSAVAALSGRRAVSGYTGWTFDLGVDDWATRWSDTGVILSGGADAHSAIDRYGVDFVIIGPIERREFAASDDYWSVNGSVVFAEGEYRIYRIG
ncbi:MAG: hypothetical protein ABIW84_09635 [Ilumatobacteraceae bacterium]